jgi:SEC-C motif
MSGYIRVTAEIREVLMSSRISRNGPCPCGSGKKYKKCCLNRRISITNAFHAGCHGDWGEFYPGIVYAGIDCQTVFVKQETSYFGEDAAVANAEIDLQLALNQSAGNEDRVVDNIQVAGYSPMEAETVEFAGDEDSEKFSSLEYALNQLVAAYIETNRPPEARIAFDRLAGLRYSRRQAFLMIKMVIAAEMWHSAQLQSVPNKDRIINALNILPNLPDFMEAAGFTSVPVGSVISA